MARKLFSTFDLAGGINNVTRGMATALATLASGKNPDATDFTLPVDQGGVTATAVATGTADAQAVAATANMRLLGFSVRESAGTPAVASLNIRNGTSAAGAIVAVIELAANESQNSSLPDGGVLCPLGVFIDRVAGESEIVVYTQVKA